MRGKLSTWCSKYLWRFRRRRWRTYCGTREMMAIVPTWTEKLNSWMKIKTKWIEKITEKMVWTHWRMSSEVDTQVKRNGKKTHGWVLFNRCFLIYVCNAGKGMWKRNLSTFHIQKIVLGVYLREMRGNHVISLSAIPLRQKCAYPRIQLPINWILKYWLISRATGSATQIQPDFLLLLRN